MHRFSYLQASSLQAAQRNLTDDGKTLLKAGGIDVLDMLKEYLVTPDKVINLKSVPGLDTIQFDAQQAVTIGALVTLQQIASHPQLQTSHRCLTQAAEEIATPQIRNVATVGGNICQRPRCWYFRSEDYPCRKKGGLVCFAQRGENENHAIFGNSVCAMVHPSGMGVALLALDASVGIYDGKKIRQVPMSQFFVTPETNLLRETILKPTEIITSIHIPPTNPQRRSLYIKQKHKESFDWPLLELAIVMDIHQNQCQQSRIVLGSVAPVPWRVPLVEQAIQGKALTEATARQAAQLVRQGASPLQHNAYKLPLAENLLTRSLVQLAQSSPPSPSPQLPATNPPSPTPSR